MMIDFTNEQLYPSAYVTPCESYDDDPPTSTYPQSESEFDFKSSLIDIRLIGMLHEAEIDFDNPNHMVHYLDRCALLVLVVDYCDQYFGSGTYDAYGFCGRNIDCLTDGQLRKLALLLSNKLGGTTCE